jgi:hypothetical protein
MKHSDDQVRTEGMEHGTYIASFDQLADWDGWAGYEYWSAQLEAEMDTEAEAEICWMQPMEASGEGLNDVLPF